MAVGNNYKTLELADGTKLKAITVIGTTELIQGFNRNVLEIRFPAGEKTHKEIRDIFSDETKTASMLLHETVKVELDDGVIEERPVENDLGGNHSLYLGSGNRLEELKDFTAESSGAPAQWEEYDYVRVAQKTYTELMLEKLMKGE